MSQVLITKSKLDSLAQSVASKTGVSLPLTIDQMVTEIADFQGTADPVLQNKTVSPSNVQQSITADSNYDGLGTVTVNAVSLQNKTATPTTSSQAITADGQYNGLGTVTVNAIPSNYITTSDATAAASDILNGKTAYVNGVKITGNVNLATYYSGSSSPASSLGSNGDFYLMTS